MAAKKSSRGPNSKPFEKHGLTGTYEHRTWASMVGRCTYPSHSRWEFYGGRGITVCQRWRDSLLAFLEDMGPRPPGGSIERIDNDGPYSPENCRWATQKEQSRNKRSTVRLTFNGKTQSAADWSDETGIPARLIVQRVHKLNWTAEKALTTPPAQCVRRCEKEYTFDGRSQTISEWARESGIDSGTLSYRIITSGWTFERAVTTPVMKTTYDYHGELLPLRTIERLEGFTRNTLQHRIRKGMSFSQALLSAREKRT